MRPDFNHLDKHRQPRPLTTEEQEAEKADPGTIAPDLGGPTWGHFRIPHFNKRFRERWLTHFIVIAVDGTRTGWDHVSVHVRWYDPPATRNMRAPFWDEMVWIKDLFYLPEETVLQFHPRASEYVNTHPHVLHLWRPTTSEVQLPPKILV